MDSTRVRRTPARAGAAMVALSVLTMALVVFATPPDVTVHSADFNGDGVVNMADYAIWDAMDGADEADFRCSSLLGYSSHIGQQFGDANRDGVVNGTDYTIWFNQLSDTDPSIYAINGVAISGSINDGVSPPKNLRVRDVYDDGMTISTYTIIDGDLLTGDVIWTSGDDTSPVVPTVSVTQTGDGVDLHVNYDNSSSGVAAPYGRIQIGAIRFHNGMSHERKFVYGSEETSQCGTAALKTYYPVSKYAPVDVIRGSVEADGDSGNTREYIIAVSVQYPLLEYQHGVGFWLQQNYMSNYYTLLVGLNDDIQGGGPLETHDIGDIPPYSTREYTISIRVMATGVGTDEGSGGGFDPPNMDSAHDNDWLYLVQPYRRYFKRLYGNVTYARDARPVNGYLIAGGTGETDVGFNAPRLNYTTAPTCSLNSPPCWENADLGWNGWIAKFTNAEDRGFDRYMCWGPSGIAYDDECDPGHAVNNPFQFTSNWDVVSGANPSHPIIDTQDEIYDWATAGDRELGLWWGNSGRPAAWGTCDEPEVPTLDICSGSDVSDADDEMGTAMGGTGIYAIGTQAVGLDAIGTQLTHADMYAWVRRLRQNNPGIRFITEPAHFDVLHTLAPAFYEGYYAGDICNLLAPNVMADFLNKGHEAWAQIFAVPTDLEASSCNDTPEEDWDEWTPQHKVKELMARLAARGYVPVVTCGVSYEDSQCDGCEDVDRFHHGWQGFYGPDLLVNDTGDGESYSASDFVAAETWLSTVPPSLRD